MPRVVQIPVSGQHAPLANHACVQLSAGVGRLNMKRCRGYAVFNGPVNCAPEHVFPIAIHSEDKAAIDHDAKGMKPIGNCLIVAAEVLPLVALSQILRCERLKADEEAAQSRFGCTLDQVAAQNGINRCGALKQTPHPLHTGEQSFRKPSIAQQMIIEKVEMAPRQPLYLCQRILNSLGIETPSTLKEGILIAKVAMLGAPSRHHDRVRHQVRRAPDEIAANRRNPLQRAACR
jgi:hypothetical protein